MAPKKDKAKVSSKRWETPDVVMVELEFSSDFSFKPGQWVMVEDGKGNKRPYSIASETGGKKITLCVKIVENGVLSNFFRDLKQGQEVSVAGPYGVFTIQTPLSMDTVFVATGTGIAPFLSMLPAIYKQEAQKGVWMVFGARTQKDLICRKYLEGLEKKSKSFHYVPVLSRESWSKQCGHVQDYLKGLDLKGKQVFVCGLPKMVEELVVFLKESGFDETMLHMEKY